MSRENEFNPGFPPEDPVAEMKGIWEAIQNTKEKIASYKKSGVDTSILEQHLKSLEDSWSQASGKQSRKAA